MAKICIFLVTFLLGFQVFAQVPSSLWAGEGFDENQTLNWRTPDDIGGPKTILQQSIVPTTGYVLRVGGYTVAVSAAYFQAYVSTNNSIDFSFVHEPEIPTTNGLVDLTPDEAYVALMLRLPNIGLGVRELLQLVGMVPMDGEIKVLNAEQQRFVDDFKKITLKRISELSGRLSRAEILFVSAIESGQAFVSTAAGDFVSAVKSQEWVEDHGIAFHSEGIDYSAPNGDVIFHVVQRSIHRTIRY